MKKDYQKPEVEIIVLDGEDIMSSSVNTDLGVEPGDKEDGWD